MNRFSLARLSDKKCAGAEGEELVLAYSRFSATCSEHVDDISFTQTPL